jgi:phosphonate transport system substrate-binding protein
MNYPLKTSIVFSALLVCLSGLMPVTTRGSEAVKAQEEIIRMGIFPRRSPKETIKLYTPMANYLGEKLGKRVKLEVANNLDLFWENVQNKKYDLVHFNPYQYVRSHKNQGYQVILKNEEFGKDTVAGAIVVRKDSGIESINDLRGKKVIYFGGPKAMLSYMVNTSTLIRAGLNKNDFGQEFTNSPNNAVFAVYFGQADAAGIGNRGLQQPSVVKRIDTSKMKYLVQSEPLTHLPWAVNETLPPELREDIQKHLANLKNSQSGENILKTAKLTGLNITSDSEYDRHRKIIWEITGENYCVRNCEYTKDKAPQKQNNASTTLVMGIFPRRSKKWTIEMFTPLAQHLSRKLGKEVRIEAEKTFDDFWSNISRQHYDIVHYNQLQYVKSHKLYNYSIIAKIEERGSDTITPALLIHKDSGITRTQDLRGKKILFSGGRTAMVSYVANTQLLRQAGLKSGDYQESFTLSPWDACEAMAKGQADSCAVSSNCLLLDRLRDEKGFRQLKILTQGKPMPQLVWSVSNKINDALRSKIQHVLTSLSDSKEGTDALESAWLTDIHPASDKEYDVHRDVILDVLGERY